MNRKKNLKRDPGRRSAQIFFSILANGPPQVDATFPVAPCRWAEKPTVRADNVNINNNSNINNKPNSNNK